MRCNIVILYNVLKYIMLIAYISHAQFCSSGNSNQFPLQFPVGWTIRIDSRASAPPASHLHQLVYELYLYDQTIEYKPSSSRNSRFQNLS